MKVTSSCATLVAISLWATLASGFPLPTGPPGAVLKVTKAACTEDIHLCWLFSYLKPSEPICGSDRATYNSECHLCFRILYEEVNITKLYDGPCTNSLKPKWLWLH